MKPIVLFDLDGTLIDSTEAILESFHHTFELFEHTHPSDAAIKAEIGHPLDDMYRTLGVEESKVWDFVDAYKAYYRPISKQKTVLLPLATEAVELAASFARLGIVTTKTGQYSSDLMEHFGLLHHFEVVIGREHVTHPKPHPEPILKALEGMQSRGEPTWIIGDTFMDIVAAKNAKIDHVGVLSGYGTKASLSEHTDQIVADALEAVRLIQKRIGS